MGGNALKEYNVIRVDRNDYNKVADEISDTLDKLPIKYSIIPSYNNKESFGDMDILYYPLEPNTNVRDLLLNTFNPIGGISNGSCLSITYPIDANLFQVDFIRSNKEDFAFSLFYYAYNDLGNLLGRVYHKMGLKFGHTGLKYILRNPNKPTQIIKELLITQDIDYILQLGKFPEYNPDRFNILEDIFSYVVASPYFNKDIFLLENRNHISRVRDKKRISYMLFLQWIENQKNLPTFDWSDKGTIHERFLTKCLHDFPNFNRIYHNTLNAFYYDQYLHTKFNGKLVRDWTGLEGKELGNFIKHIKHIITNDYFFNNSLLNIQEKTMNLFRSYYGKETG